MARAGPVKESAQRAAWSGVRLQDALLGAAGQSADQRARWSARPGATERRVRPGRGKAPDGL